MERFSMVLAVKMKGVKDQSQARVKDAILLSYTLVCLFCFMLSLHASTLNAEAKLSDSLTMALDLR